MTLNLPPTWQEALQNEIEKPYFDHLIAYVRNEYRTNTCYPELKDVFNALLWCPLDKVKVVIMGQDPYHGPGQADGLSFSVKEGIAHPPSLRNIFKELGTDLETSYPENGNLKKWAEQGVLLLNATLTVRAGVAGSHQNKGWEVFTDEIIKIINAEKNNVVFLLWGGIAKKKEKLIDTSKHYIITSGHPSPLSANRGYWFGNKCFSQTNSLLKQSGALPIEW